MYKNYSDKISISLDSIEKVSIHDSENIWNALIKDILTNHEEFTNLDYRREYHLKFLINDTSKLSDVEILPVMLR